MTAPEVMIREATALDAEAIARARVLAWRVAYRDLIDPAYLDLLSIAAERERFLRQFQPAVGPGFTRVAADANGRVIGYAQAGPGREPPLPGLCGEVYTIYLLPSEQRRGVGTLLMRSVVRGLQQRGFSRLVVWCLADNAPARRFYESLQGAVVAHDRRTVGGQWLDEVAYGWVRFKLFDP